MKHEPPPRPLRDLAPVAMRVMEAGGRYLLWLGAAILVLAPFVWLINRSDSGEVLNDIGFTLLGWAAILVGWHLVLTFLRWWIWWHEDD